MNYFAGALSGEHRMCIKCFYFFNSIVDFVRLLPQGQEVACILPACKTEMEPLLRFDVANVSYPHIYTSDRFVLVRLGITSPSTFQNEEVVMVQHSLG